MTVTIDKSTIDAFLSKLTPGKVFSYREKNDKQPTHYAIMFLRVVYPRLDSLTDKIALEFWVMPGTNNIGDGGFRDCGAEFLIKSLLDKDAEMATIISPENMQ